MTSPRSILIIRFGAMGDVLHALPAVESLKLSFPQARLSWVIRPNWQPLIEGNPAIDQIVPLRRGEGLASLLASVGQIRGQRPDLAIDFQGLIQSAVVGRLAKPRTFWGLDRSTAREPWASVFYTHRFKPRPAHRVKRNLHLAQAAGADHITDRSWLPQGQAEGNLPDAPFVLATPFAGWGSKQWPLERYRELSNLLRRQGVELVLNVAPQQADSVQGFNSHVSSIPGLINATRRAAAVVGVDSGPIHLAAALRKPGVAIFGPTDPFTHGPFGGTVRVIRKPGFATTYKRDNDVHASMLAVTAEEVFEQLMPQLRAAASTVGQNT